MNNEFRTLSQSHLLAFCLGQDQNFKIGKHHRKISRALERVAKGECKRLIINMPPRHGKSYLCNYLFPLWFLGNHPDKNIISVSYSQELAMDFGRKIRNHMTLDQFKKVFPDVSLAEDSKSASKFSTNAGGDYFALGAGGSITGRGAHIVIMDDMIKGHLEARSRVQRDTLREWYSSTLRTRLMPGGSIVLIMTRWSIDDIAGWLISKDKGEWEVLSLPAIDENDEPLWGEQFSYDDLMAIKREVGSSVFNALYQQKPSHDNGLFIRKDWLKYYDTRPAISEVVISWDTTFKDTDSSDYCVGVVLGRSASDQRIYLLEVVRRKMDFVKTREAMRSLASRYPGSVNLIEESANGHALLQTLQSEIPNLIGVKATDSKESRMQAISPIIESGQVIFPNPEFDSEIQECIDELIAFNKGQHDDFCDALSQGLIRLRNQAIPPWLDQLSNMSEKEVLELHLKNNQPKTIEQFFWPDQFMDKE